MPYLVMKEFCKSSDTIALFEGSGSKQLNRNDFSSFDRTSGISGCSLNLPTLKTAASGGPS